MKADDPLSSTAPPNNLHRFREEIGLSKAELARMAKLNEKTIARVERRKMRFRIETYRKIFNALNAGRRSEGFGELRYDEVFPPQS